MLDEQAAGLTESGEELWQIISEGRVRTFLQPIAAVRTGAVIGYEALSRGPVGSLLESPDKLFFAGRRANLLFSLERVCRWKALLAKNRFLTKGQALFVNMDTQVLSDARDQAHLVEEVMGALGITPSEVVFELTERAVIRDYAGLARAVTKYVELGYRVAVDDVGAGYSNLRLIAEIRPHFIKVDMSLIRGIDTDQTKRALLETMVSLAEKVEAAVVAEGVETAGELKTVRELGVGFVQGYFLARPAENPPTISSEAVRLLTQP